MTDQTKGEDLTAGLPVPGYRPQSNVNLAGVGLLKTVEEQILRILDDLQRGIVSGDNGAGGVDYFDSPDGIDLRWLAIGRTNIEQGFMAINRAIFKPSRVSLATDRPQTLGDVEAAADA